MRLMQHSSLVVFLSTVAGVVLTTSLGFWQLRRADEKQLFLDTLQARQQMSALSNASLPCQAELWKQAEHRRATLHGRWLNDRTLFLDNRVMQGRTGFVVLTPLQLLPAPSMHSKPLCKATTVLVQRGWVPRDPYDRTRVPLLKAVDADVSVPTRLSFAPSKLMEFTAQGEPQPGRIRQNVDLAELEREWGVKLFPGSAQQLEHETPIPADAPELLRQWWQPTSEVGKHQAYAAQWFAMAAIMGALYAWFQWWQPLRAAARQ